MITRKPHEDAERNEAMDRIVAAIDGSALHTFEVRELAAWIAEGGNLAHLVASIEDGHEAAEQRAFDRDQDGRSEAEEAKREAVHWIEQYCSSPEAEFEDAIPAPTEAEEQGREARQIERERQDAEDGVDRWADWEPAPEPYEPNPYDGTYSED